MKTIQYPTIEFISAGPTRTGRQVQARFRVHRDAESKPVTRAWSLPASVAKGLVPNAQAAFQALSILVGGQTVILKSLAARKDVLLEVGRAVRAMRAVELQLWQSLTCDHSGCRRRASQFLQTWIDTLICRCWMHRIPSTDMRRDIREISREEAEVLYIQGS